MTIEFGQFATFCVLVAAILKLIDWFLLDDQKMLLRDELRERLNRSPTSFAFIAKTPILALDKVFSGALNNPASGRASRKRTYLVSSLLIVASLFSAGFTTDSVLGFEESPSDTYRKEIRFLEAFITQEKVPENASPEEVKELKQLREGVGRILETAQHPFTRWVSLAFVATLMGIISVAGTSFSLTFAARTARAIITTDHPILLIGAVLLNGCGSLLIFFVEIIALSLASSILLLFAFSLLGILLELGPGWGLAVFSGYGVFAWLTAPVWLKALAIASMIPFLLMVVAIVVTAIIFPIRKPVFAFLESLFQRLVTHREGPVAFLATAFACLAAAIIAATALIN